jgi:hypothetical protein
MGSGMCLIFLLVNAYITVEASCIRLTTGLIQSDVSINVPDYAEEVLAVSLRPIMEFV